MNVLRIMQKDVRTAATVAAAYLLMLGVLAVAAKAIPVQAAIAGAVILSGPCIIGALLATERHEEKNHGYMNLLRMPVLPAELAAGKLLLMYLLNVVVCALVILFVRIFGTDIRMVHVSQSIVLMAGCLWLVCLPAVFSGICLLGYTKFVVAFRFIILALLVATQAAGVAALKIGKDLPALVSRIGDGITSVPWLLVCVLISAGYFAFSGSAGRLVRLHGAR